MKIVRLGGLKLDNGVYVKPYSIKIYDGDLHEMPERVKQNFERQMFAAAKVPTDMKGINTLNSRFSKAITDSDKEKAFAIASNLLSGLHQVYDNFTCKNHAFYSLIEGVTNFTEEVAKKTMKLLYSHGLNSFNTDSICEDVKKKYIPNYEEITQAYTKAQSLVINY